ncbi:MAG: hypothetical protein KDK53_21455 [Maritimibacter sp.]|nr:hypothetical protein [Maritimibacter sp.]
MQSLPGNTIAALCYARKNAIDFAAVKAALSQDPWNSDGGAGLDMPTGDFALRDVEGQRIGLAHVALDRTFPGTATGRHFPSCLLVSVGSDGTLPAIAAQPHHDRVLADLLLRLQEIAPADRVLMFERAGVFDAMLHDAVVDDLRGHLDKVLAARAASASGTCTPTRTGPVGGAFAGAFGGALAGAHDGAQLGSAPSAALEAPGGVAATAAPVGGAPSHRATHPAVHADATNRILPPAPSLVPPLTPSAAPSPDQPADPSAPKSLVPPPAVSGAAKRAPSTVEPDDIVQLAARLETELDRLGDIRRALSAGEATAERSAPRRAGLRRGLPQGFPRLAPAATRLFGHGPAPTSARMRDSRPETAYPDYEHMPANVNERPLLHRAAVNALNVTVMSIALPVGAALLTMSVFGREDMLTSSRVTAVTGVAVALHNTGAASWLQSLFV